MLARTREGRAAKKIGRKNKRLIPVGQEYKIRRQAILVPKGEHVVIKKG